MESRILIALAVLFALGALLVATLQRLGGADRLWRLFALQALIVAVILLPAYLGGWWWIAALLGLGLRAQYELLELRGASALAPRALAAQVFGAAVILAAGLVGAATAAGIAALSFAALLATGLKSEDDAGQRARHAAAFSLLFPVIALAHLALFDGLADAFAWLALLYIVVEVNDSIAYLTGRTFGKRRLLPRLSPNKTVLGLVAGVAAALVAGMSLNAYVFQLRWDFAVTLVLVSVAGGLAGDLATSALKRQAGRKDFATVLEAHGGVLDIYDSLFVAAPLFLACHRWLSG